VKVADKHCVDLFFEHAQQILEVAQSDSSGSMEDFALLIRPDGGLHFIMETPFTLEAASQYGGARSAYRVTRSEAGVRVEGFSAGRKCLIEERSPHKELLRDQPLYRITSSTSATTGSAV
jgi:hypothetical protein